MFSCLDVSINGLTFIALMINSYWCEFVVAKLVEQYSLQGLKLGLLKIALPASVSCLLCIAVSIDLCPYFGSSPVRKLIFSSRVIVSLRVRT